MHFCTVHLHNRVVSSDLHTLSSAHWQQGFKAYHTTERTEHATISQSDCAIQTYTIIIFIIIISARNVNLPLSGFR